ncbi:hypothetical protein [Microcoleus sp. FACHB-831]|nr:hypothetical protein [Microcoleus sp. FACHB-831]
MMQCKQVTTASVKLRPARVFPPTAYTHEDGNFFGAIALEIVDYEIEKR